jgi:hypothetical protein
MRMQEGLVHYACKEEPLTSLIASKDKKESTKLIGLQ